MRRSLEALRVNLTGIEHAYLGGFLQRLRYPALVLDKFGRVKAANRAMETLLDGVGTIKIGRDGRLEFADGHLKTALADMTAHLSSSRGASQPQTRLPPTLKTASGSYQLAWTPMAASISDFWGVGEQWATESVILLTLNPFALSGDDQLKRLRQLYGLTPAEARICMLLSQGVSMPIAAQRQGVSYETARSHLKSIFSKIGVTRQTELVALLHRTFPGLL
jgi:DNA-binding CsgD family transcriptional regulator